MSIKYNQELQSFYLNTKNTTYIISIVDDKYICNTYYGEKVKEHDLRYLLRLDESPFTPKANKRDTTSFLDSYRAEYPSNGIGDYRESAIDIKDFNNQDAVEFLYKDFEIMKGKPKLEGLPATFGNEDEVETLIINAYDPVLDLELDLYYSVFSEVDAISRNVIFKNTSANKVELNKIYSLSFDLEDENYEMLSMHGSWARERTIERSPIHYGKQSVSSIRGESSHQEHPFIALVDHGATQTSGNVYGFSFVYSGNFIAQIEKNQFDTLRVSMGIHPYHFNFLLEPGETFTTPEVVMTFSSTGLGQMTRNYHDLYRNHLIRSKYIYAERPVLINNWEATYFDFDEDKIYDIAKRASELGVELFVLDDGWFGKRDDDNSSLGDWFVDENKLPNGLKSLNDKINKLGMQFGLWFEPEMVSPDSDLYRKHPEWAIAIPNRDPSLCRNQYVLDLSNPEVVDYAYEAVAKILRETNISYVKWDMNRQLSDLGSAHLEKDKQGELSHRYVLGVYEMQERLVQEFPDLLLENCSGGGARFDPGMLYYSPQIWASDNTDAISRLAIQEGTALVYPLSTIGSHVSVVPNHTVGRVTPFSTRGNVAMFGTFGYELDITKLSSAEQTAIPDQIANYKEIQPLIQNGDYYRLESYRENGVSDSYIIVDKNKEKAVLFFVNVLNKANVKSRKLKLQGLDSDKLYRVSSEDGESFEIYGDALQRAGILIKGIDSDFFSKRYYIEAI